MSWKDLKHYQSYLKNQNLYFSITDCCSVIIYPSSVHVGVSQSLGALGLYHDKMVDKDTKRPSANTTSSSSPSSKYKSTAPSSADLYKRSRPNLGPLKLKGSIDKTKKHKRKHSHKSRHKDTVLSMTPPDSGESEQEDAEEGEGDSSAGKETIPIVEGTGRIVSTGTTLQGFETKFMDEVKSGDEIMLQHPTSLQVESRTVMGVFSNRSLTMSFPFSTDLVSTNSFHIKLESISLQRKAEREMRKQKEKRKEAEGEGEEDESEKTSQLMQDEVSRQLQKKLCGAKATKYVSVREKTGMWGYKTISKTVTGNVSAEKMLDIRCKQGRDKYCF
eukprot:GHVQ01015139.1.p2 GENE.GHVQ01015139.1~~GHVQ01015139.1.p2  ORF type:complete len:331 (+),score=64.68 GHVQ01015139.1:6647-7639(+)